MAGRSVARVAGLSRYIWSEVMGMDRLVLVVTWDGDENEIAVTVERNGKRVDEAEFLVEDADEAVALVVKHVYRFIVSAVIDNATYGC